MIRQDSDTNGGDEQDTEQATLDEVVDDLDLEKHRNTDWLAGIRAGVKALVILSVGMWGLFYLMHTDTLHIAVATGIATGLLMEMFNISEFLNQF